MKYVVKNPIFIWFFCNGLCDINFIFPFPEFSPPTSYREVAFHFVCPKPMIKMKAILRFFVKVMNDTYTEFNVS